MSNFQSQKPSRIEINVSISLFLTVSMHKHDTRMDKQYEAHASMHVYDNAISLQDIARRKLKIRSRHNLYNHSSYYINCNKRTEIGLFLSFDGLKIDTKVGWTKSTQT